MMRPRVSTRGERLVRAHPWTANSVAWAFVIGAAAIVCTMAARWTALRLSAAWPVAAEVVGLRRRSAIQVSAAVRSA